MSTPTQPAPDRARIRCADSDRQLVCDVLNSAYAEGRITHEEHTERLDATWQARTFGDLTALTDDLMPQRLPVMASAGHAGVVVDPAGAGAESESIVTVMGNVRREGRWRLRRRTTGLAMMGDVKLDLRQATFDAHECIIQIPVVMGDVTITVPDGINVRDETTTVMADTKVRGLGPASPSDPTIVLRGLVLMGDVKVNGPAHESLGQRLGLTR